MEEPVIEEMEEPPVEEPVIEEKEEEEVEEEFKETSASRVVLRILNHLIPFLTSKERGVRYRTAQFLALLLSNSLPTFPFDYSPVSVSIFKQVRAALTKRVQDKEAIVRVQASIGLVRLLEMGVTADSDAEQDSDEEQDAQDDGIIGILIEAMQNDPSAYNPPPPPPLSPPRLPKLTSPATSAVQSSTTSPPPPTVSPTSSNAPAMSTPPPAAPSLPASSPTSATSATSPLACARSCCAGASTTATNPCARPQRKCSTTAGWTTRTATSSRS